MIRRAQVGERRALDKLGVQLTDQLLRFFSRFKGAEDAWELTQATLVELFLRLNAAPTEVPVFRAWVMAFANNMLARATTEIGRQRAREAKLLVHLLERELEPGADLEAEFGNQEMRTFLEEQLETLPKSYQQVLKMRLRNHSFATIAVHAKITAGTARRYLWLGIKRIQQVVERERATRSPYRSSGRSPDKAS